MSKWANLDDDIMGETLRLITQRICDEWSRYELENIGVSEALFDALEEFVEYMENSDE